MSGLEAACRRKAKTMAAKRRPRVRKGKPVLLSGGNPQIAKADGDAPVQAYIAAIPGWKRDVARRLDALIVRTVPGVRKAVKWNSPFYGVEGQGWFLSFHCFTKYVKVTFFRGSSLRPVPPGESKHKDVRYLDIHEDDQLDEEAGGELDQAGIGAARLDRSSGMKKTFRTTIVRDGSMLHSGAVRSTTGVREDPCARERHAQRLHVPEHDRIDGQRPVHPAAAGATARRLASKAAKRSKVTLAPDTEKREIKPPPDLAKALGRCRGDGTAGTR